MKYPCPGDRDIHFFITVAYKYNLNRNPGFGCDNKGTKDISGTGKINEFFQSRKRILSAIIGITLLQLLYHADCMDSCIQNLFEHWLCGKPGIHKHVISLYSSSEHIPDKLDRNICFVHHTCLPNVITVCSVVNAIRNCIITVAFRG